MSQSRVRESNLWNWLRQAEQHVAPLELFWERIENGIARGTPDIHGVYRCVAFVCELKAIARTTTLNCELRNDQALKLRGWWHAGGLSWILVQVGMGRQAVRYLVEGRDAAKLCLPISETYLEDLSVNCLDESAPLDILRTMIGK
jgi:hypothetical protein